MKDNEIRGMVLKWFYENRGTGWVYATFEDSDEIKASDSARACEQLAEHGLIQWSPTHQLIDGKAVITGGNAKITAAGVDVVEESRPSPLSVLFDHSMNVTVSNSNGVQVGHGSSQDIGSISLLDLRRRLEEQDASVEQKAEVKNLWNKLLEHPLTAAVIGSVAANLKF